MNPWFSFAIGMLVGATFGLVTAALCFAARGCDDGGDPQDQAGANSRGIAVNRMKPDGSGL